MRKLNLTTKETIRNKKLYSIKEINEYYDIDLLADIYSIAVAKFKRLFISQETMDIRGSKHV